MVTALALVIISNHSPSGLISEPFPGFWGPLLSKEVENAGSAYSESLLCLGPSTGHRLYRPRPSPDFDVAECCRQRLAEAVGVCCQAARWLAHSGPSTALPLAPLGSGLFCQLSLATRKKITTLGPRTLAHLAHSFPRPLPKPLASQSSCSHQS